MARSDAPVIQAECAAGQCGRLTATAVGRAMSPSTRRELGAHDPAVAKHFDHNLAELRERLQRGSERTADRCLVKAAVQHGGEGHHVQSLLS